MYKHINIIQLLQEKFLNGKRYSGCAIVCLKSIDYNTISVIFNDFKALLYKGRTIHTFVFLINFQLLCNHEFEYRS